MNFVVNEENSKQRLDVYVTEQLQLSRAFVGKLNDQGKIEVNGIREKAGYKLKIGDKISVDYDHEELKQIPDIQLPILYEDDDCLVINKPVGILTHSKGAFNPDATVSTFLQKHISDHKNPNLKNSSLDWEKDGVIGDRVGIVHRLDRATSGVIVCAKSPAALAWLQKQFSQRKVKKTYYAVIEGTLDPPKAVIEMPIERNPKAPKTFRVGSMGKPAVTQYEIAKSSENNSLIKLQPLTGRTHQLRVHLNRLGHPIIGDTFYEGKPADRLYLHAESLEITLPSRERKIFVAPLPADFSDIMG